MNNLKEQTISTDLVIQKYHELSTEDPQLRFKANDFLCQLVHRDQAWEITQSMLTIAQDPQFQFLGTQILYQKVSNELDGLLEQQKIHLREFVFTKLADQVITYSPIIDKLASIGALIASTSVLQNWNSFVFDLVEFMKKSQHNLKSGLFVLERVPQELRSYNRLSPSHKNAILEQLLKSEKLLYQVFISIFSLSNTSLVKKCFQAMQSWAKSRFNFLKYPDLIQQVLFHSLLSFDNFQLAIVMIVEAVKGASINKLSSSLTQWQPDEQLKKYQPQQIQSIKLIIQFIITNKKNFLSSSVEPQHSEMFLDTIKNSLLSFSFLIKESIGFQLLDIILIYSKNVDLRVSQSTFQFWMDFSQKMQKCKLNQQIKNMFGKYMEQLFFIVCRKVIVDNQQLLDDPDMKDDVTIDDINAMSFSQYRRESSVLYQILYSFFLNLTASPKYFFDKCFEFIGDEGNNKLGRGTELALFCIRSATQSMISRDDAQYLCKFIGFIIEKGTDVYARIVVQTILLIRDCTRQIKGNNYLCLQALNYSLYFLNHQKICHYAAQSFKILMETITQISDPEIVKKMLQYYSTQNFPNDQIVDKIIQGIFTIIIKLANDQLIESYLAQFVGFILLRFQSIHDKVRNGQSIERPYLLSLKQIKSLMDNFDIQNQQFKKKHSNIYCQILKSGLQMISFVLPYSLQEKQKYIKFNELGLSCSIYKHSLKLCFEDITLEFLNILDQTLNFVLQKQVLLEMCHTLDILCYTLTYFVPKNINNFNNWLIQRIPIINNIFVQYMNPINLADVDVIRVFYEIQQSLVLYNSQIFLNISDSYQIFDLGLYILRHLNEPKMQRKVVNFLYVCTQMNQFSSRSQKVLQTILSSVPIIASISHHNISRIFIQCSQKVINISKIVDNCLQINPYENLSKQSKSIFLNLITFTVDPTNKLTLNSRQRNFMIIIKDLNQFAKLGQNQTKITQIQFRLALWKKNINTNDQ